MGPRQADAAGRRPNSKAAAAAVTSLDVIWVAAGTAPASPQRGDGEEAASPAESPRPNHGERRCLVILGDDRGRIFTLDWTAVVKVACTQQDGISMHGTGVYDPRQLFERDSALDGLTAAKRAALQTALSQLAAASHPSPGSRQNAHLQQDASLSNLLAIAHDSAAALTGFHPVFDRKTTLSVTNTSRRTRHRAANVSEEPKLGQQSHPPDLGTSPDGSWRTPLRSTSPSSTLQRLRKSVRTSSLALLKGDAPDIQVVASWQAHRDVVTSVRAVHCQCSRDGDEQGELTSVVVASLSQDSNALLWSAQGLLLGTPRRLVADPEEPKGDKRPARWNVPGLAASNELLVRDVFEAVRGKVSRKLQRQGDRQPSGHHKSGPLALGGNKQQQKERGRVTRPQMARGAARSVILAAMRGDTRSVEPSLDGMLHTASGPGQSSGAAGPAQPAAGLRNALGSGPSDGATRGSLDSPRAQPRASHSSPSIGWQSEEPDEELSCRDQAQARRVHSGRGRRVDTPQVNGLVDPQTAAALSTAARMRGMYRNYALEAKRQRDHRHDQGSLVSPHAGSRSALSLESPVDRHTERDKRLAWKFEANGDASSVWNEDDWSVNDDTSHASVVSVDDGVQGGHRPPPPATCKLSRATPTPAAAVQPGPSTTPVDSTATTPTLGSTHINASAVVAHLGAEQGKMEALHQTVDAGSAADGQASRSLCPSLIAEPFLGQRPAILQSSRLSRLQQRFDGVVAQEDALPEAKNVSHLKEEKRERHKQQAVLRKTQALQRRQSTLRIRQGTAGKTHADMLACSGLTRFGKGCSARDVLEFIALFQELDPARTGRLTRDSMRQSALHAHAAARHGLDPGTHVLTRLERVLQLDDRYSVSFEDCLPHVFPSARHGERHRMVAFYAIHRFVAKHLVGLIDADAASDGAVRFFWSKAKATFTPDLREELELLFFRCAKDHFGTIGFPEFLEVLVDLGAVSSVDQFLITLGRRSVLSTTRELEAKDAFEIMRIAVFAQAPRTLRSIAKNVMSVSKSQAPASAASWTADS